MLFPNEVFATNFKIEIDPLKALEILNKPTDVSKKLVSQLGFKLWVCQDDYCEWSKTDNNGTYTVIIIFEAGKANAISVKENINDFSILIKSLSNLGFEFRADKSYNFIQTGFKESIVDGVLIKTIVGTPPKVAVPGMRLRFDMGKSKSCFIISPTNPSPYNNTFTINYSNFLK